MPDDAAAAKLSSEYGGFCEINLNTGCPSSLVSSRCFGARLMLEPERVRDICASMQRAVAPGANAPEVTVKCRIGVDDHDSYEELHHFITTVASCGVRHFIVHARKCLLKGLSPHENRTVPPLRYDVVYRLKTDFPDLRFTLNGGVASIQQAKELLDDARVDGVMIGRAAYNMPWNLRDADRLIFGAAENPNLSRREIIAQYLAYAEDLQAKWGDTEPLGPLKYTMRTSTLIKPLLALFKCVLCRITAVAHDDRRRRLANDWRMCSRVCAAASLGARRTSARSLRTGPRKDPCRRCARSSSVRSKSCRTKCSTRA